MTAIATYSTMVQSAAIVPGPIMAVLLTPATAKLNGDLQAVKIKIQTFKSKNSFTI